MGASNSGGGNLDVSNSIIPGGGAVSVLASSWERQAADVSVHVRLRWTYNSVVKRFVDSFEFEQLGLSSQPVGGANAEWNQRSGALRICDLIISPPFDTD
ncbi:hypothetical protein AB1N83_002388 [Pleurotus pulmonarius]